MVALEAHPQAPSGPLPPALAAFLDAYVECKSKVLATAGRLKIRLETALEYLADPALKARLATLDESERREARQTAIATINRAIGTLSRFTEAQWLSPSTLNAATHLYRASVWLVRIVEGKVTSDRLPRRLQPIMQPDWQGRHCAPPHQAPIATIGAPETRPGTRNVRVGSDEPLDLASEAGKRSEPERDVPPHVQSPLASIGAPETRPGTRNVRVGSEPHSPAAGTTGASTQTREPSHVPGRNHDRLSSPHVLISRAGAADTS